MCASAAREVCLPNPVLKEYNLTFALCGPSFLNPLNLVDGPPFNRRFHPLSSGFLRMVLLLRRISSVSSLAEEGTPRAVNFDPLGRPPPRT